MNGGVIGASSTCFAGLIRSGQAKAWKCEHHHPTRTAALECAAEELLRGREPQGWPPQPGDVWADRDERPWTCGQGFLTHADTARKVHPALLADERGPLRLVHRAPARPVVYFIERQHEGRAVCKIGFSAAWDERARKLATGSGQLLAGMRPGPFVELLLLPGTMELEREFHHRFAGLRVQPDREWFYMEGALSEYLASQIPG